METGTEYDSKKKKYLKVRKILITMGGWQKWALEKKSSAIGKIPHSF